MCLKNDGLQRKYKEVAVVDPKVENKGEMNGDLIKICEEYFISSEFQGLFSGNNQFLLKNLLNFKSSKTSFMEFLEEYVKQILHKQKTINP